MARKPKTRITVNVGGVERELFSILDRGNGELLLLMKAATALDVPIVEAVGIKEERYSLHPSDAAMDRDAVSLKYTVQALDGAIQDAVALAKLRSSNEVWCLRASRVGLLNLDRYSSNPGDSDTLISLSSSSTWAGVLVYFIFVGRPDLDEELLSQIGLPFRKLTYSRFSVTVVFGYMNVPAIPNTDYICVATSLPRINREKPSINIETDGNPLTMAELPHFIAQISERFGHIYIERMKREFRESGGEMPAEMVAGLAWMTSFLTPEPIGAR